MISRNEALEPLPELSIKQGRNYGVILRLREAHTRDAFAHLPKNVQDDLRHLLFDVRSPLQPYTSLMDNPCSTKPKT